MIAHTTLPHRTSTGAASTAGEWAIQSPKAAARVLAIAGPVMLLATVLLILTGRPAVLTTVVFPPTIDAAEALATVAAAGGWIVDTRLGGRLVLAVADRPGFAGQVREMGALVAVRLAIPGGCTASGVKKHNRSWEAPR